MAKKSKSSAGAPKTVKKRSYRAAARRGVKRMSGSKGIRWGEAILSLAAGYLMPKVLTPVSEVMKGISPQYQKYMDDAQGAISGSSGTTPSSGEVLNKVLGAAAATKIGYDVAKGKSLSMNDKSVILPYIIGAMLDPQAKGGSNGGWQ